MRLQFIGSGDAFGSGGRFNTCFHVQGAKSNFLIDCGASALVAMKGLKIDRNAIDLILLTHFHLDHFGGVPFFILDAQLVAKRGRPLTIAGPLVCAAGTISYLPATFPGSILCRAICGGYDEIESWVLAILELFVFAILLTGRRLN